jgi:hypothetical protein
MRVPANQANTLVMVRGYVISGISASPGQGGAAQAHFPGQLQAHGCTRAAA